MSDVNPSEIMVMQEVKELTKLNSKTSIRKWVEAGKLPKPIEGWPGQRHVWRRAEVLHALGLAK